MDFELRPVTAEGRWLAELAEKHASAFAATADQSDRDNTFPYVHWAALRESGLLAAGVPTTLGGRGVTSVRDLVVAVNRLARGDGAIAIGVAMHLSAFWYLARQGAAPEADPALAAALRLLLRRCARGRAIACVAVSESGRPLGRPHTTATPHDGGYRIDGRKSFCTGSPVGTVFLGTVRVLDPDGVERLGFALIPRETSGCAVEDTWDALGMRASGSHDVVFAGCVVPSGVVRVVGELGVLPPALLPFPLVGSLLLLGAALGIAERARDLAVAARTGSDRPTVWSLVGENEADVAIGRSTVERAATLLDESLEAGLVEPSPATLTALLREVTCANLVTRRAALAVVDRALTIAGGRSYLTAHPLSRLYRDVRAAPFMQPFAALDAPNLAGRLGLGLDSDTEL